LPVDAEPAGLHRHVLGITRVGGVAALINTKLVGLSLSHCINVADADTSSSPMISGRFLRPPCRI